MQQESLSNSKFYEPYTYFARTLRGWLVAYGLGVPLLVASQAELTRKLVSTGVAKHVVLVFLTGVLIQILTAFLYKYAIWMLHLGETKSIPKSSRRYQVSLSFYRLLWPTVLFDVSTIALFVWPTFIVLSASAS
jgi:hypothetical protein